MKNGINISINISIYLDGELFEYRYDADLKREYKLNLDIMLEQYLRRLNVHISCKRGGQ